MKAALIALDSTECSGKNFERFSDAVRLFQKKGIIPKSDIASVYHPSLTPLPHEFYQKEKARLAMEARTKIRNASKGRFDFSSTRVLLSPSPAPEDHVRRLSNFGKRHGAEMLVVASHDRKGLLYWLLGSFSETAALRSELPVLVFKPDHESRPFSRNPRFVFAVDLAARPSMAMLQWISDLARSAEAVLELVYVVPRYRPLIDSLQARRSREEAEGQMMELKNECEAFGANARTHVIEETASVAHSIEEFADDVKAWLVAVFAVDRPPVRRILIGSRARRLLALTKRPFLSLRFA